MRTVLLPSKSGVAALALTVAIAAALAGLAAAQTPVAPDRSKPEVPNRKPDLGDMAEGVYRGEIISDSRGTSSAAGTVVTVTIKRIAVNRVSLSSDNDALPGATVALQSAMQRVIGVSGITNVLLDPTQRPWKLDYSPSEQVSFAGVRQ